MCSVVLQSYYTTEGKITCKSCSEKLRSHQLQKCAKCEKGINGPHVEFAGSVQQFSHPLTLIDSRAQLPQRLLFMY